MNNAIMFSLVAFNLVFIGIFLYHAIFTIDQRVRIDIVEADLADLESEVVGKLSADVASMKDEMVGLASICSAMHDRLQVLESLSDTASESNSTPQDKIIITAEDQKSIADQVRRGDIVFSGENLKKFRRDRNFSQASFGAEIGCTASHIYWMETHKMKKCDVKRVVKMARILNIQAIDLFKPAQQKGASK